MRTFGKRAICVAICCLPAGHAAALDAQAFVGRLETALELNFGLDFAFGPMKHKGDVIVVSGLSVGDFCPYEGTQPFQVEGELRFIGISEDADGAYRAQAATLAGFEATFEETGDDIYLSVDGLELSDIYLAAGQMRITQAAAVTRHLRIDGIEAGVGGYPILSAEALEFNSSHTPEPGEGDLTRISDVLTVAGMEFDVATLLDLLWVPPEPVAAIEDMGLGTIKANLTLSQDWALTQDRESSAAITFSIEDGGRLTLDLGWRGYTAEVWQEATAGLHEIYSSTDCSNSALLLAADEEALRLLRDAIELTRASLRYRDESLAGKLITLAADAEAADVGTVRRMLAKSITRQLAALGLGDHAAAVTAFLADPRGFLISTNLEEPVRFSALADAMASGGGFAGLLDVTAVANPQD